MCFLPCTDRWVHRGDFGAYTFEKAYTLDGYTEAYFYGPMFFVSIPYSAR